MELFVACVWCALTPVVKWRCMYEGIELNRKDCIQLFFSFFFFFLAKVELFKNFAKSETLFSSKDS